MAKRIEINSDMGESYGNFKVGCDELVMPYVTTVNAGCGFHGGDAVTLKRTAELAKKLGVAMGAHPSYPDLMGFGRREMKLTDEELFSYTIYQVGAVKLTCEVMGLKLHHIKPHGVLYKTIGLTESLAAVFIDAIFAIDPALPIYHSGSLENAAIGRAAKSKGIRFVREFYADTDYDADGSVVVKKIHGAVNPEEAADRVINFLQTGAVKIGTGETLEFEADSICVHGDNPSAVDVLKVLRQKLTQTGYEIAAI